MRSIRRGRPSLVGSMARTAVIAGTATAVSNRVNSAQQQSAQQRAATQQAQIDVAAQRSSQTPAAAPVSRGALTEDNIARLKQVAELHKSGILTAEEFESEKAKILAS